MRLILLWLLAAPAAAGAAVDLRAHACAATAEGDAPDPARLAYDCTGAASPAGRWRWVRVDPRIVASLPPRVEILTPQVRLDRLVLVTDRADGSRTRSTIDAGRVGPDQWAFGGLFRFSVDRAARPVTAIYLGFDRRVNDFGVRSIEAVAPAEFRTRQMHWLLLAGLFVGGVGASVVGSLFFYRALRTSSHLWYAGWAVTVLVFGLVRTSLVFAIEPVIDANAVVRASLLLIAATTGLSLVFFAHYVEPGVLPRRFRRGAVALALAGTLVATLSALDPWIAPRPVTVAFAAILVAQTAMILLGILVAMWRSSRAAWFYALASVLPLAALMLSIAGYFRHDGGTGTIDLITLGALTLQAVLLFVGHADRFAILHREHRAATNEQAILRRLSEVVFHLSNDGCWTFLNPAWEDLSGERVEESLGRPFTAYLHPDDYVRIAAAAAALRRGEIGEFRGPARYAGAGGSVRWVSLRLHLRYDEAGTVIGTGGSFHDITERHLSALALAASERRHRALTETSIAGIFECDAEWRVGYVNPAFCRISGLTLEQALDYGWLGALRPDYRVRAEAGIRQPRAADAPMANNTLCYVHPDGSERWCLIGIKPTIDDAGEVTGYAGIALDITDQHVAREALVASESRFEALARLSPAVIFRTDPQGNCSFANAAWTTLTGRPPEQALGFGYVDAVDPADRQRLDRGWRTIAKAEVAEPVEYRFVHSDGGLRWTTIATARETDADGTLVGFVGVITDITAQKKLEHDLTNARAAAELAATTDELTGLANRRQFMARLGQSVDRCRDGAQPSLAMIDVDYFKRINDTLGHPSGDEVLRAVGRILRANMRSIDLIGRVGGEEFALLMPGTDCAMAEAICERMRSIIATSRFGTAGGTVLKVTVSVGVARLAPGETMSELISRTDQALYLSKNRGRNQVQLAA